MKSKHYDLPASFACRHTTADRQLFKRSIASLCSPLTEVASRCGLVGGRLPSRRHVAAACGMAWQPCPSGPLAAAPAAAILCSPHPQLRQPLDTHWDWKRACRSGWYSSKGSIKTCVTSDESASIGSHGQPSEVSH